MGLASPGTPGGIVSVYCSIKLCVHYFCVSLKEYAVLIFLWKSDPVK